jgi:hypothetical protein
VEAINRKLVQRKEITDIDRAIDFVNKLFFNAELPSEQIHNLLRSTGFNLEPDGDLVGAVPDLGLHGLQKIHHFVFVEVVVVVPRDPERDDVFDLHSGKQALNVLAYEVLEENKMVSLHVFIDRNKPWQDGGDFNEGVSLGHLDSACLLENGHEVEAKIGKEWKRMPRIDGQRR